MTPSTLDAGFDAAVEVLLGAVRRGADLSLSSDQLRLRPLQILTTADRETLHAACADQPRIAHELLWRVVAMRRQIPPRPQPIPMLVARLDESAQGVCVSCGAPRPEMHRARCPLCALAVAIALGDAQTPTVPEVCECQRPA